MDRIIEYFFNFQVMAKYWPKLWSGFLVTLEMAVLIVVFGLLLGLLVAVIRAFQIKPVNWVIIFFVDLFRAVPALVLLTVIYFALPYAGISIGPFSATVICLIGVLAVYAEEIFWAGIISIDRGQWEAARSTGLNFIGTLFFVVLPQAIRMCIPPMTN